VQYLDLGNEDCSRKLVGLLEEIRHSFSTRHKFTEPFFQIFRSEQRAIGELMLQGRLERSSGSMLWRCRGYAYFCAMLERDDTFKSWFSRLKDDVRGLTDHEDRASVRLVALQNALIDLIDSLDVPRGRIPEDSRRKISRGQSSGPVAGPALSPGRTIIHSVQERIASRADAQAAAPSPPSPYDPNCDRVDRPRRGTRPAPAA
jgi:hypothetical protein